MLKPSNAGSLMGPVPPDNLTAAIVPAVRQTRHGPLAPPVRRRASVYRPKKCELCGCTDFEADARKLPGSWVCVGCGSLYPVKAT